MSSRAWTRVSWQVRRNQHGGIEWDDDIPRRVFKCITCHFRH
jgi:hypothetical protein